jgi:hypothetical protein
VPLIAKLDHSLFQSKTANENQGLAVKTPCRVYENQEFTVEAPQDPMKIEEKARTKVAGQGRRAQTDNQERNQYQTEVIAPEKDKSKAVN